MTTGRGEFDAFARDYKSLLDRSVSISGDTSEYFCEYKARYVARTMGADFSGKILDFGCGVGLLSVQLKKHLRAAKIHGYDVSSQSLEMIPPELARDGRFSDRWDNLDSGYDLAVISNVMHHIPKDQRQRTIVDITSHLAPGGKLILFEHNPWNPFTRWVVRHCPFDDGVALLRPKEVSAYLARASLAFLKCDFIVFFPKMLSPFRRLEPWVAWLPAGAQYAVVGEKHAG